MLGGESSGGLSTLGHIPEKDGILANLMIAELAATENKPLSHIVKDVKARLGQPPHFQEYAIKTAKGSEIMDHFSQLREKGGKVAGLAVDVPQSQQAAQALQREFGTQDGVKLYLENGGWLLVRKSGTEPLARIYTEVSGDEPARQLHQHVQGLLKDRFAVKADSVKTKFDLP